MRKLLFSIGTLLYTVTCMGTSKKELPNILFLLVDDMQRTCIHHNGCEQVSTPNIDRIYQNGILISFYLHQWLVGRRAFYA